MDQQNLSALLEELHRELSANPPTDERSQQLLAELQRDIARAITPAASGDASGAPAPEAHHLRARLQEAIAGFEGTHPQSSGALERVMVLLSNFGL